MTWGEINITKQLQKIGSLNSFAIKFLRFLFKLQKIDRSIVILFFEVQRFYVETDGYGMQADVFIKELYADVKYV